jgi:phosphoribosylformylglycinamidine synthase
MDQERPVVTQEIILALPGGSAHLDGRIAKRAALARAALPGITSLIAEFVHLVECPAPLDAAVLARMAPILTYAPIFAAPLTDQVFLVLPRPGTVSPWSSKATDILHNCGFAQIRRIERAVRWYVTGDAASLAALPPFLHDRMTEACTGHAGTGHADTDEAEPAVPAALFAGAKPEPLAIIPLTTQGRAALVEANQRLGLALAAAEIDYLLAGYAAMGRDPTDAELMMFAQANSEHCRHKTFRARFTVDGVAQERSLFEHIQETHRRHPNGVLSAYRDNAAVARGYSARRFFPGPEDHVYGWCEEEVHLLIKVETHNHPTAISPFPGAATGTGGEIRDEAATGRGGHPKAGLVGFAVSDLCLPGLPQPWEEAVGHASQAASALEIMLDGPLGAAAYANEFGRPTLAGFFRTFTRRAEDADGAAPDVDTGMAPRRYHGYHKPIMLAGGMGNVRPGHVEKRRFAPGAALVVLGGPALRIGLGGGAASSLGAGTGDSGLDFASVQRDNAEMERRCQEVIESCLALGAANPILAIHDVGAGGLSNAFPELVHDAGLGGDFDLRKIPSLEPAMSPLAIWSNESQERYCLALAPESLPLFAALCERERCPHAVVGTALAEPRLIVRDPLLDPDHACPPVDLPLDFLLGAMPRQGRQATRRPPVARPPFTGAGVDLSEAARLVLTLPAVADKSFLITIGDRTVTGLVARDQMVGPWQLPVADCAVTLAGFGATTGEAMALGERTPVALLDPPASGRLAVGEALTNIAAARIRSLQDVVLSANWMAACGTPAEDAALHDTVAAISALCVALQINIPVGKDSLSMRSTWRDAAGVETQVSSPVSLVCTAFAPVLDAGATLTPDLKRLDGDEPTVLLRIDLGRGRARLGGSALAQCLREAGGECPDLDDPARLAGFFLAIQCLNDAGLLLAYHDIGDGGLFVTLVEMALAGRLGVTCRLPPAKDAAAAAPAVAALFSEELGAVVQCRARDADEVMAYLKATPGLQGCCHRLGAPTAEKEIVIQAADGGPLYRASLAEVQALWSRTSYEMQALREDPETAREEYAARCDVDAPGLCLDVRFLPGHPPGSHYVATGARPRVAILREQGVNGHVEMAAAFDRVGFAAVDVHMSDLLAGRQCLDTFHGVVACGGFSYGDCLGAGGGWAANILHHEALRAAFAAFLADPGRFALGVCNGCQMLSQLQGLIPGAAHWPRFLPNRSGRFEARLSQVEVLESPSLFFSGMAGSRIPIAVAHGEGRATFADAAAQARAEAGGVCLRFVDGHGAPAALYPANPNGSPGGITGLCNDDGRVTILMPHPERLFLSAQYSWLPPTWTHPDGPWLRLFQNARAWLEL